MKKIGILTSGGDAPGMNAAIYAVFNRAKSNGISVIGIKKGYKGLINDEFFEMQAADVEGICKRGGTILKSARSKRFKTNEGQKLAIKILESRGIEGLVVIGGNGSLQGAKALAEKTDMKIIGVPSSIDNDINGCDLSIGFSSACDIVTKSIDNIKDTAVSFHTDKPRIFAVEAMGRRSGWISVMAGMAAEADLIIIPEENPSIKCIANNIRNVLSKKNDCVILYAEGISRSDNFIEKLKSELGYRIRHSLLGFQQRGGSPTTSDRILALRMGNAAVDKILEGDSGKFITIQSDKIQVKELDNREDLFYYNKYLELFSDKIVK
ncbi:6-phosphofructokinase [Halanaerobium saccharolyticum subsp. saccharolyticum DSM 6643]|uniref:6-phosphofructokinase n=1 Tax=Halanaerobium saccharolyticum subsp. saccharolyticum DSM 6643 TaxID=1293054 RepID=M5EFB6_9FIRM|nr:ATP-dependent 6-phosphofructokinase [Halanaerobium saccharolyticum]CCU79840.1 6-phosphofructokinase [Halanaerobium saccharolyticum subsp. saccharolyticum DSM 6643]